MTNPRAHRFTGRDGLQLAYRETGNGRRWYCLGSGGCRNVPGERGVVMGGLGPALRPARAVFWEAVRAGLSGAEAGRAEMGLAL